ncbi:hypothetical protein MJO29_002821 [Puccinia striiformis f. sp. tritici]|uniref:hypothetical protein n=1 Tax=Puccinia striiformis f. sp. tritici TaxID=168172 RepID=UPI002008C559|nr:hypothetical protein Pst134EA_005285 [Puccinia striiformis f. sp. tritici]KAH9471384.1 hypothetical protein Pst134EA_005285 [Puccinia striiformis f. sp. tritici]KAI7964723.1 hypothetical protein MJO29_002821 [Puccinia striiformis f. sp. tritici]
MQDLLEEFDPLSKNHQIANTTTASPTTKLRAAPSTANIRKLSNISPLFSSPTTTTTTSTTTASIGKIKPQTDHLSSTDLDPLGSLITQENQQPTQQNSLLLDAQIRSQYRKDALAKHLAHEPFRAQSPTHKPLITLQEPMTCFVNPTPPPSSNNSIKIPSEIFQNQINKSKPTLPPSNQPEDKEEESRTEPLLTKPIDQHKLAAALLEDFDDFVSANDPPNPSSSPQEFQTYTHKIKPEGAHIRIDSNHSTPVSFFEGHEGRPHPITFIGMNSEESTLIIDEELAEGIRLHLPSRLKIPSKWKLVYSIEEHGTSIETLYQRMHQISSPTNSSNSTAGCILVIKDGNGNRFGGFVNEPFKPSKEYYGTGECFLWKAVMFEPDDFRIGVTVKVFLWTGVNDYMILSDHDLLSIGGGDGKFGLWIDSNLDKGASSNCPAFNNEILCDNLSNRDGTFEVIGLECWTVSID